MLQIIGKLSGAVLSGMLLAASFPNLITPGFAKWPSMVAWVALVPLLTVLEKGRKREAFGLGYLSGLVFFACSLYWVTVIREMMFFAIPAWIGLSAVLALYPALFALGVIAVEECVGTAAWVMAPFWWVMVEWLRGILLTGFPWNVLAASQYSQPHLLQMIHLTGQWGLSALIVWVNVSLAHLGQDLRYRHFSKGTVMTAVAALLVAADWGYGAWCLARPAAPGPTVRVAVLQGNIPQDVKWSREWFDRTIQTYERLTLDASSRRSRLIVWPETAVPDVLSVNVRLRNWSADLARRADAFLLIGTSDIANPYETDPGKYRYLNSAVLVAPDGRFAGSYNKMRLVPFGEYIPFRHYIPGVEKVAQGMGEYVPGSGPALLTFDGLRAGALICYETIFPEISRSYGRGGACLLAGMTNDAWYQWSAAAYQHASFAVLRAVENRLPVARAANTGVSMFVSPEGRILQSLPLFTEGVLVADLPAGGGGSFYSRWGDWFVLFSAGVVLGALITCGLSRLKGLRESA